MMWQILQSIHVPSLYTIILGPVWQPSRKKNAVIFVR
jgi:hypothetical protein